MLVSFCKYFQRFRFLKPSEKRGLSILSMPTLAELDNDVSSSTSSIAVPKYDRSNISAGIVHIGVGNFHRSHMATYLDDLFHDSNDQHHWGIVGAGVMKFDAEKQKVLARQDWLSTLVERDAESEKTRVIGSMIDFLPVEDHAPLKKALLNPAIKIVSLTLTEGGYYTSDGVFDPEHPNVQHDVKNPESPSTTFGILVQALKKRRQDGSGAFTIMSCDNVPHNGDITKSVVVGLAELMEGKEHSDWIRYNVAFPNSMVDRITIGTSDTERNYISGKFGYKDESPVFSEPYRQWILEDTFSQGRPALERVGVTFVDDVTPYEKMKIRVLNGGHGSLCYPAALLGVNTVSEAMEHPVIGPFLDALERNEIIPSVPPVPDTDVTEYWKLIATRFSNPKIGDSIGRICYDGASRQPKFIIRPAADGLKDGRNVNGLALVSAMWCRYCQGKTEGGKEIAPNDPIWDRLHKNAVKAQDDPSAWLGMKDIYGSLGRHPKFAESFSLALRAVSNEGVGAAMQAYIDEEKSEMAA